MIFTDAQRQHLKYAHNNYLWDASFQARTTGSYPDAFITFLVETPIYTGIPRPPHPPNYMHITQRNILVLLHKLGVKYN